MNFKAKFDTFEFFLIHVLVLKFRNVLKLRKNPIVPSRYSFYYTHAHTLFFLFATPLSDF